MHLPRRDGKISLERTGPYIPPITFPGPIILTAEARTLLEASELSGFSFLPVVKAHIAELHWEDWDLNLTWPPQLPESGEPEDYVLAEPHSASASAALGEIWEVVLPTAGKIIAPDPITPDSLMRPYKDLSLDSSAWNGADFFRGNSFGFKFCSARGHDWLSRTWGEFVWFDPFPSA